MGADIGEILAWIVFIGFVVFCLGLAFGEHSDDDLNKK